MKLLDLYCGAGGAGMGYHRAGFEVTGVDINPQPRYPFTFIQGDALEYIRDHGHEYDVIHASPPCQSASLLTRGNRRRPGWTDGHRDLIPATRTLLASLGRPYVIENVVGAAVRPDLELCGLMFGLRVFRHRLFEICGFAALQPPHPTHNGHRVAGWRHGRRYDGDMFAVYGEGGDKGTVVEWQQAMGMDWTSERVEIREAIPPAYTRLIGDQLMQAVCGIPS